jgi:hypothetical protein
MGKKNPQNGRGGGGGRKRRPPRPRGDQQPSPNRLQLGEASTSSRLLLTHVAREGAIWEVFVTTKAAERNPATVQLEFVHRAAGRVPVRHSRPVSGAVLEALHTGGPLRRADLEQELEEAIQEAGREDPSSSGDDQDS